VPIDHRPEEPSPALLDHARVEAARLLSFDPALLRWPVGNRVDRKRSTLFPLALIEHGGNRVVATAFFKASYFPPEEQESRHLGRVREALVRSDEMGRRFMDLVGDAPIKINVTLALDEESLQVVTLGLEGKPMGHPLRHSVGSTRRRHALETCAAVGKAIGIVEAIPRVDRDGDIARIWEDTERKIHSVAPMLDTGDVRSLERAMAELYAEAILESNAIIVAHGDLSTGNVIMMEEGTGLIDFGWIAQLRGFDLSRFVHRLRYTTPSYGPWTDQLIAAVLDGYGDADAPSRPGWRFSEMQRLLATVQRLDRRGEGSRRVATKALDEIRAGL
jgi:hypothetical protein